MRNIIRLIQKYKNFLFFLILEVASIFLLFNWRNSFHSSNYVNSTNSISAGLFSTKNNITSYFKLRVINEALMDENTLLKEKTFNKDLEVGKRFIRMGDSLYFKSFKFQKSKIINSQFKFSENNLLINKGKLNGIEPKMGFIGTKGIFGIIDKVSDHYSSVKPLINAKFGLKVVHQLTSTWGDFKWIPSENNYRTAYIENIPIYTHISKDDYFITTGSDGIFPYGIKIGKVLSFVEDNESQTLKVTIEIEEDYSEANIGFTVKNLYQEEINYLKYSE
jgi:rod shape-determining protein MreC